MKGLRITVGMLLAVFGGAQLARAEIKLPAVFSDHMVLQRDAAVPVWGTAAPGETVTVEFAGQKKTVTADANGKWLATLDPLKANAEPGELKVGGLVIHDVLVGEVWLGSGQSNMAFGMRSQKGFAELKPKLKLPTLRFFTALERSTDSPGTIRSKWDVCTPETAEACSAVLFFFGRALQDNLDGVPVGLINASVGGTSIRLWIDRDLQMAQPEMREGVERDEQDHAKFDEAAAMKGYYASARYKDWQAAVEKAKAAGQPAPRQPYTPLDTHKGWLPAGSWFRVRVAPLIPYGIRGVVWYQGEADGNIPNGLRYRHQLPALIRDWRARWGQPGLPFALVQLPFWKATATTWSAVRESQLKTLALPHTGLAVTLDIGDPNDVHPNDKTQVGHRLAQWALGEVYGRKVETSGPLPGTREIRGGEFHMHFEHAAGLTGRGGAVKGFTLAGADKQWHPAVARIAGDAIVVSSPEVPAPVALRYAWDANPENCNLYNGAGLPASPFRTDEWELK